MPEVAEEDHATYANLFAKENYFAGMRISTLNAGREYTEGHKDLQWLQETIPQRRIEEQYPTIYNLDASTLDNLNQTSTSSFVYQ